MSSQDTTRPSTQAGTHHQPASHQTRFPDEERHLTLGGWKSAGGERARNKNGKANVIRARRGLVLEPRLFGLGLVWGSGDDDGIDPTSSDSIATSTKLLQQQRETT